MESFRSFLLNNDAKEKWLETKNLKLQEIYEVLLIGKTSIPDRVFNKYRDYLKDFDLPYIAEEFPQQAITLRYYFIVALYEIGKKIGRYKAHFKTNNYRGDVDDMDYEDSEDADLFSEFGSIQSDNEF